MGVPYPLQTDTRNDSAPAEGTGPGQARKTAQTETVTYEYKAAKPRLIAIAEEKLEKVSARIKVDDFPDGIQRTLDFNDKMIANTGRKVTHGSEVPGRPAEGPTDKYEALLKQKVLALPAEYDNTGKAVKEFNKFLEKQKEIIVYEDPNLNAAVAKDPNFTTFSNRTMNAPGDTLDPAKYRLHQALEKVGWDINKVVAIGDLSAMAFNTSQNHSDGLTIMIDAVSYMHVFVESYFYDSKQQKYEISLLFQLHDAFGLNDIDLQSFGYNVGAMDMGLKHYVAEFFEVSTNAHLGFTAWWQLQHEFGYAPMVTSAKARRHFSVSTRK